MSGWWRLFVVLTVLWALAAAYGTVDLRGAKSQEIVDRQLNLIRGMCDGVDKPTASASQREQCNAARQATVESELAPWSSYAVVFMILWLGPLALLLGVVSVGRWVVRGFRRTSPTTI